MPILIQSENILQGVVLLLVPHFDDEVLSCGGMLALLPAKERLHVLFATAGDSLPTASRKPHAIADPGTVRQQESIAALDCLGISTERLHFLNLPEKRLATEYARLSEGIGNLIRTISPDTILLPFRFDQHPDHLALASAGRRAASLHAPGANILEYFVYFNYPLLPRKDIRQYCKPDLLYELDISAVSEQKKQALNCFTSQTTLFYPGQCRPVLSATLIAAGAAGPEYLLRCPADRNPCTLPSALIQGIQHLQPRLKQLKEYLRVRFQKLFKNNG